MQLRFLLFERRPTAGLAFWYGLVLPVSFVQEMGEVPPFEGRDWSSL